MNDPGPLLTRVVVVGVTLGLAAQLIGSTWANVAGWVIIGGIVLGIVIADLRARKNQRSRVSRGKGS